MESLNFKMQKAAADRIAKERPGLEIVVIFGEPDYYNVFPGLDAAMFLAAGYTIVYRTVFHRLKGAA